MVTIILSVMFVALCTFGGYAVASDGGLNKFYGALFGFCYSSLAIALAYIM